MKTRFVCFEAAGILAVVLVFRIKALDEIPDTYGEWTEQGVVLEHSDGWDNARDFYIEDVLKVDGTYYMYFLGGQNSCWGDYVGLAGYSCIGVATSTDGKNFTRYSENPVIRPEQASYVSSWEHGCRTASFCYNDQVGFMGYVGVDFTPGQETPGMAPKSEWYCDVGVDTRNHVFTSEDGLDWTYEGVLGGIVGGGEMNSGCVKYVDGSYYFWPYEAEPNMSQGAAKGSNYRSLSWQGWIEALNFGWSEVEAFVHNDNSTVTLIYWPFNGGHPGDGEDVYFATTALDNMLEVTDKRVVRENIGFQEYRHSIIKDVEAGEWKWYYSGFSKVSLRTAELDDVGRERSRWGNHTDPGGRLSIRRLHDRLTVGGLDRSGACLLQVLDVSGRVLESARTGGVSEITMPLRSPADGVVLLRVQSAHGDVVGKVFGR